MDVRLCLGLVKPGPTGPFSSVTGADVDGLLVRVGVVAIGAEGVASDDRLIRFEERILSGGGGYERRGRWAREGEEELFQP